MQLDPIRSRHRKDRLDVGHSDAIVIACEEPDGTIHMLGVGEGAISRREALELALPAGPPGTTAISCSPAMATCHRASSSSSHSRAACARLRTRAGQQC